MLRVCLVDRAVWFRGYLAAMLKGTQFCIVDGFDPTSHVVVQTYWGDTHVPQSVAYIKVFISGEAHNLVDRQGYDLILDCKDLLNLRPRKTPFLLSPMYAHQPLRTPPKLAIRPSCKTSVHKDKVLCVSVLKLCPRP